MILLDVLKGAIAPVPPVWMMRQAGRYLPEYREVRATARSFLDFCYTPELAIEVTLQPIRRFGFDAAIIFSDILVVPDALRRGVHFVEGEGPRLTPLEDPAEAMALRDAWSPAVLEPVYAALGGTRVALPRETTLLGFCGAPWTIATYMIAGRGTPDQAPARLFAYRHPEAFQALIDTVAEVSAQYLIRQLRSGADAVQIFDSWAGVLPGPAFDRWCIAPVKRMVAAVRAELPDAVIIGFPRGVDAITTARFVAETGVNAVSLDTTFDLAGLDSIPKRMATQGNLDPLALIAGGEALDRAVDHILVATAGRPHVFNLGHGITPQTPIAHVERMLARVRGR